MKDSGLKEITNEERQKLIQFRQDISFLRSAYETLSKDHKSPKKFDTFVKVFGKLKDLILMNDSEKSQALATLVVQSFDFSTFSKLVVEKPMAQKKSIKNYVKDKKTEIKRILNNKTTVDQIHTLRKSIRNLYRYLLIQKDLVALDETQALQFKYQLKYLKQINDELGMICDTNASLILDGQIKKNFPYKLELSLLQRIEYFISVVQVDYADNVNTMTKDSYE
jgi:CHAD domain-containing protein